MAVSSNWGWGKGAGTLKVPVLLLTLTKLSSVTREGKEEGRKEQREGEGKEKRNLKVEWKLVREKQELGQEGNRR